MLTTVTQELRAKRGNPSFGNCMGSRIMIRGMALERFYATLELQGCRRPFGETRNTIPYGKNRKGCIRLIPPRARQISDLAPPPPSLGSGEWRNAHSTTWVDGRNSLV